MILSLFIAFFRVGLFAIGGGLATLPFLYEVSSNTHWFSHHDIANILAISESTPGALGVNMATFAGFKSAGILGSLFSTLGLITPSIIIIVVIAHFFSQFKEHKKVKQVLYALRPASMALITLAAYHVAKTSIINVKANIISEFFLFKAIALALLIFFVQKKIKLHPIFYLVVSAILGMVFQM